MKPGGYFVISLDFELMWGMFDKVTTESYGKNIMGVQDAIPETLALFKNYDIHATWATVGMLMCKDRTDLYQHLPDSSLQPIYSNPTLSSYRYLEKEVHEETTDHYHFAPELVKKIVATPGQELASHTFSHYYCIDGSENAEGIFAADCRALKTAARKFGIVPTSIVFPRNQTTDTALRVCQENGLTAYRGTEEHWLYQARGEVAQTNVLIRGLRLIDHYCNLSGHNTYTLRSQDNAFINIPASRFLRPYSKLLRLFEPMRLRRIKNAMTHAAKHNEVFHLWWHPHNFGVNRKENLENLINILEHYQTLKKTYGMESRNMQELALNAGTNKLA